MRLVKKPQVYLIDKPMPDDEAVGTFRCDSVAPNWVPDTQVSDGELVEIAGRTCHMSFEKPRPRGNKAYTHTSSSLC
jgi:hypothetical protein